MRWIWIDHFELFESGKRAVAIKNVTQAEDHLHDHFPGYPVMPASLLIEGMAQTAGILVGEAKQFCEKVILAKIKRAVFHSLVLPGDQVRHEATRTPPDRQTEAWPPRLPLCATRRARQSVRGDS